MLNQALFTNGYGNPVVGGRQKFTFWLLLKDRLNTRNILRRKRRFLDDYSCPLCMAAVEETSHHLFFTCSFSQWCWRLLNIQWHMNMEIKERIIQGHREFRSIIFREVLLVAIWAIWTHRRWKKIFRDELSLIVHRAKLSLKLLLYSWLCNST